ncbi:EAL domain-containing protein [Aliikangiella sp. IMCC44632]
MTFSGDPNWMPFESFQQGVYQGIVAEYIALIEQKINTPIKIIEPKNWQQAQALLLSGQVDLLSETTDSKNVPQVVLSDGYFSSPIIMVKRNSDLKAKSLSNALTKKIAVVRGYGYSQKIKRSFPDSNLITVANMQDGLLAVSTGEIETLLCSLTQCSYLIKQMALHNLDVVATTEFSTELAFASLPKNKLLLSIINKSLESITDTEKQAIMQKWSSELKFQKNDYTWLWNVLLIALAILAFIFYRQLQLKEYNRRLRHSEERYARAVKGAKDGIWDWELETNATYLSPRWKALLGYDYDELSNDSEEFFSRLHPDDKERVITTTNNHLAGKGVYDLELRLKHKSGEYRWYRSVGQAEYDSHGVAIKMAGILSDINQRKKLESLEKSRNYILELTAKGESLHKILTAIVETVEAEKPRMICSILILASDGKYFKNGASPSIPESYTKALEQLPISSESGSCGSAVFHGKRIIVKDISSDPLWKNYKDYALEIGFKACWSQPIINAKGKVLGTFAIYHKNKTRPSTEDITIIEQAATLAGIAIEKHKATEELQLASLVYQHSSDAMMIFDSQRKIISVNPAFSAITGYAADEVIGKEADILNSEFYDDSFYQAMSLAVSHVGSWQGEIKDRRKSGEIYYKWLTINTVFDDEGKVYRRVALFSDISERKQSEKIIWQQANYDFLTDLPNRSMFNDRLKERIKSAQRDRSKFALLLIDLDHFKEVNDSLGHDYGDILLREAVIRINASVRESDTVARLGGDEFTIILSPLEDEYDVERVTQSILDRLSEPFTLANEVVYISASIGITLFPEDANSLEGLLKNADQAMYEAKKLGRNGFSYFTKSMQVNARNRMRLIADMRRAITQQEFLLLYQPIVNLSNGKITKAEALIRWQHPDQGLISPTEFIPLAEETGMIKDIGDWVLKQATMQVVKWRETIDKQFQISVNTSAAQYINPGVKSGEWFNQFSDSNLDGDALVIEITESLIMDARKEIKSQLIDFRNLGIQVALDDFGTGYSSLAYLKKFDIDYIKIDRAFVSNLEEDFDNRALCEAIVVMAHKLNLYVIAEGVETEVQKQILTEMKCDFAQGFFYSKPVLAKDFVKLVG